MNGRYLNRKKIDSRDFSCRQVNNIQREFFDGKIFFDLFSTLNFIVLGTSGRKKDFPTHSLPAAERHVDLTLFLSHF